MEGERGHLGDADRDRRTPWVPIPPSACGGTEAVIDELARGLVGAGHEVQLFTTRDSTCPVPKSWVYERSEGWVIG